MASNSTDKDCLSKSSGHKGNPEEQVECTLSINVEHCRKVVWELTLVLEMHKTRVAWVVVVTEMQ